MFQFTTTNVINSKYESGYTPVGDPTDEAAHQLWSAGLDGEGHEDSTILVLKRIGTFKADQVLEIDRAMPVTPVKAKAIVDLVPEGAKDGDTCRLNLYIGLSQGSNDAMYANDYWYKGKPLTIEYTVKTGKTAENFVKMVKKFLLNVCDEKFVDFKGTGDTLTITMTNEYQRFRVLNIELLIPEANNNMGEWKVLTSLEDLTEVKPDTQTAPIEIAEGEYFAGREGFGTYDFILHNLRIPTDTNAAMWSVHENEKPVPGAKYVQYTIHQCANRGPLGLNAVGQNVQSTTTHVLYVLESLKADFEAVLTPFITEGNIKNFDVTYTPWNNASKVAFV